MFGIKSKKQKQQEMVSKAIGYGIIGLSIYTTIQAARTLTFTAQAAKAQRDLERIKAEVAAEAQNLRAQRRFEAAAAEAVEVEVAPVVEAPVVEAPVPTVAEVDTEIAALKAATPSRKKNISKAA